MTRVCLVTGEYPPDEGGVADYTRCLADALAAQGVFVDVLTTRRTEPTGAPPARLSSAGGVAVHGVVPSWRWPVLMQLHRAVRTLAPDIVHIQYQTAAFGMHPAINTVPRWLRQFTTVKTAVTYHDLNVPYLFPKAGRLRRFVNLLPARFSHLTVATNAADHAVLAEWGRAWELALVPIGSNIPDAPPPDYDRATFRQANGIADGTAVLVYFGFLNASKGGRDLIDVVEALRGGRRDVRLVMIGGKTGASDPTNAAYLARFEADVTARGLTDAVVWTGHVSPTHVSAWLHAADVAVLPYADGASYRRGSLLAALTHGVPTVTTRPKDSVGDGVGDGAGDGAGETARGMDDDADAGKPRPTGSLPPLVDGVSARLVRPGDTEALVAAVRSILDDPVLAARLGEGARAVAGHFGWDAIAAEHLRCYHDIIERWKPMRRGTDGNGA
jgi:glycosyltransferase involved in cell wall biosynthesis